MKIPAKQLLFPAATGALMVAAWYAWHARLPEDSRFLLPTPDLVIAALREHREVLAVATLNTVKGALIGFGLAVVISTATALTLSLAKWIRASLYPYLMILQMTPIIVIAPMLVLWVGPGLKSVAVITFLISFFPMVVNTTQGLLATDRNLLELFRMQRATPWQEILHLRVPAAMPGFFTGLRIAAVLAPIGAIVGDYTAGSSAGDGGGLGFRVIIYASQAKYPALFATAGIGCALGFVFTAAVVSFSWLALHRWHDSYERRDH
ncbi:MAG: ABC transporter permease subunit [Opitutaceae bacterium]|nr:ABC transporter permease subunit [Opitutaceae bacterium]